MCNEIEGLYDKIIITVVPIKLYRKKYHSFVAIIIGIVTRNNTDGNKLVIFSGIASYYNDTYIVTNSANP